MRRAVFLDRDGTIIEDEGYLAEPSRIRLVPGAVDALRTFREGGFLLIVVSNQSGIPRGLIAPAQHAAVDAAVKTLLIREGAPLDGAYYCAHLPQDGCACRKPNPGMIEQAARDHDIDVSRSIMIGDKFSDVAAGRAAGCITGLLGHGKDSGDAVPHHRADSWQLLFSSMEPAWKP